MKNFYDLLGIDRAAPSDEIKRAFRREIARYHPDKVQHLGAEFQQIAETRAAELTEAYRVLMDAASRETYDAGLAEGGAQPSAAAPAAPPTAQRAATRPGPAPRAATDPGPAASPAPPRATNQAMDRFVKKAALGMLAEAIDETAPSAESAGATGFEADYTIRGKRSLFGKSAPDVRLLARFVAQVDPAAVHEVWPLARAAGAGSAVTVVVLLIGAGLSAARDLSAAIAEQRRKARGSAPIVVPTDVRDWEALLPPETPPVVRTILQRLRQGKR